jgi:hypothetical protein
MSTVLLLVVLALGAARLTRLVVEDTITLPLRQAAVRRLGAESKVAYLLHCRWCTGLWVSTLLVGTSWATGVCDSPAVAVLLVPAVAYAAAIVTATIEE